MTSNANERHLHLHSVENVPNVHLKMFNLFKTVKDFADMV
jgi:hypothetical protein